MDIDDFIFYLAIVILVALSYGVYLIIERKLEVLLDRWNTQRLKK